VLFLDEGVWGLMVDGFICSSLMGTEG